MFLGCFVQLHTINNFYILDHTGYHYILYSITIHSLYAKHSSSASKSKLCMHQIKIYNTPMPLLYIGRIKINVTHRKNSKQ